MRSSLLLASAFAVGTLAGPIEKRVMVTEVDLEVVTVTVFVTPGEPRPTATMGNTDGHGHHVSKSTPAATPSPSSSPAPAPPSPAPESSSVVVAPSSATPTPTPTPEATSAPASTPEPESSTPASSSQAPASSGSPFGEHTSGVIQATFHEGAEYQASVLWHHNRARANHGADPLTWSTECEAAAKDAASKCDFVHHVVDGQGQNLFTVSGDMYNVTGGITDSWYKGEADLYGSAWGANPDTSSFEKWGHMTQVVWKSTTSVGCVTIDCGSAMTIGGASSNLNKYTVCNYSPPGNYEGQYAANVAAPLGDYNSFLWSD